MTSEDGSMEFDDIGVQRVRTGEAQESLQERKRMGIDQELDHDNLGFDKEALRLCFQVRL